MPRVEGNEDEEVEMPAEETAPEFCLAFAKIALQLVTRGARMKVENIIQLVFGGIFDAGEVRWNVKGIIDYRRISGQ